MKIVFGNGQELAYLNAVETEEFWGGSNRRTLRFTCEAGAMGVDALNTLLNDTANTASLTLHNAELEVTNIYEGYTMKLQVGIDRVQLQPQTAQQPATYGDRLIFKLGQPTYIEAQLARLGVATAAEDTNGAGADADGE